MGIAVKQSGLHGEKHCRCSGVRGFGRFGGVLGVDHPEQLLRFPVGHVYWRERDNDSCCDGNDFIFART
jgi:hypothetical protein